MKPRRICSLILLIAMILSTLVSCGFAAPMMRADLDPSDYPSEAQAKDVAITENLGDIRVMSFNVQNTVKDETKENRYLAVVGQIQDYAPTLLGLQEDGLRTENDVKVAHWDNYLTDVLVTNGTYKRINDTLVTSEYCSIYYDTSILGEPIASGAMYLTYNGQAKDGSATAYSITWGDIPQPIKDELNMTEANFAKGKTGEIQYTKDGAEVTEAVAVMSQRSMSYGIFEMNGQKFLYVNTHLTHRSQGNDYAKRYESFLELRQLARMAEWDILHANVGKLLEEHGEMPVIITGDLNEVPGSPSYNHYATYYNDASKLAKIRKGPDGTWNAAWDSDTNGEFSTSALKDNQANSTLDYCFISPDDFTVEQFQVAANRRQITNSKDETGYVAVSDHLAIITDLSFGKENAPMTLEKPGLEKKESEISYYDATKDLDYSWFDEACITNPETHYTFTLTTANQLMAFLDLRQNDTRFQTNYFFDNVTIKLGANMVFNQLKDGVTTFTGPDDWKTQTAWQELHSDYHFKGTFDGQGHYISGVYMPYTSGAKGLLGAVGGEAVIKNLALVDSYLRTPTTTKEAKNTIGSMVARVAGNANVTFYNLYSDCIMEETNKTLDFGICGGLVGAVLDNSTATFEYCTFAGSLYIEGNKAGGILGQVNYDTSSVIMSNCINAGEIAGNKYVGGLVGYVKAVSFYANNCANIGDITAGRCSGGLIGTISTCPDLLIVNCAVNANLDFSQIGAGGTAEIPVEVPAGCQVGGLIGRTYYVDGFISGISLAGSLKGAANIVTGLDTCLEGDSNYTGDYNHLAAGGIIGFNAYYATDDAVKSGSTKKSHIHIDTVLVSMEVTNVDSYLGGARELAINSSNSKVSYNAIIYDVEKFAASGLENLWGYRVDKDRILTHKNEINSQIATPIAYSTAGLYTGKDLGNKTDGNGNAINYYTWKAKFTTWQKVNGGVLVPTVDLSSAIHAAMKTDDLFVLSYQTKANAEDANLTDFRFVSVMKDTGLPAVGYHVTMSYINGEGERASITETVYCSTVYTSIKGGNETYEASTYGGDYIFTLVIGGVPVKTAEDIIVTLQPFAAEQDGEEILFTDYRAMTYALN